MKHVLVENAKWNELVAAKDLKAALWRHLGFVAKDPHAATWLRRALGHARKATIATGDGTFIAKDLPYLKVEFPYMEDGESLEDEVEDRHWLLAMPALDAAADCPPGWEDIARLHNGLYLCTESFDCNFAFAGVDQRGSLASVPSFAPSYLATASNKALLDTLAAHGLEAKELRAPFLYDHCDWIIVAPAEHEARGRWRFHFVSHADVEVQPPYPERYRPGDMLALLLASRILGWHRSKVFSE